ncbi:hypothetical protein [Teichococcus aestuarii]|uniref:hypothetical protein n=1 Tax=Teichococcus aestuarii TaxID=568898 RepID=UPI00361D640D
MAEEQGDADDKQLDASQRRLDRAREQGDVPLAREAVQLASRRAARWRSACSARRWAAA